LSDNVEDALTRLDAGGNGNVEFNELVNWMISVGAFSL
jgi:Ca2+-binding EF-hand superfamily protein